MKKFVTATSIILLSILNVNCSGPTKAGKEARLNAHNRMDSVNADLAAQQARQQFEVGQLDDAVETINAAIARYSENGLYHLLRGRILLEQHRLDAAYQALTTSAEYSPLLSEPHYFLGVLHQRWGEDDEALVAYKKAMELDSTHPQYLLATAESLVAMNKYGEAIHLLTNANREFQHHPSVSSLLGQIHLSKGEPETAANWFADSRLLGNDDIETLLALAHSQFEAGLYADCLRSLDHLSVETESLSTTLQRIKGKCLSATGRIIEGRDICLKVTRETPDDASAWIDLGFIAWDMGDYRRLGVCGKKIQQLDPTASEGALFEGISAIHSGKSALARKKLSSVGSDNSLDGLDFLLDIYEKHTKLPSETPITPNMQPKTTEGQQAAQHQESALTVKPLVIVPEDFPDSQ